MKCRPLSQQTEAVRVSETAREEKGHGKRSLEEEHEVYYIRLKIEKTDLQ